MNKMTKIGLTALAGSLVATSAFAGSMSVSGSAKVTYKGGQGNSATNNFSNSKGISFSGSGELDNGFTVSTSYTMTNAAFSTSTVSLDMGDAGSLHFMNSTALAGIDKYDDVMPTAGEEVWDDVDTDDNGVVGVHAGNAFGYNVSAMGLTISAGYSDDAFGNDTSLVLVADDLMDGLQLGYGIGTEATSATAETDHSTMWAKYTVGMATVGMQMSSLDNAAADEDRTALAISLAINENMSVSYGVSEVEFEAAGKSDEDSSGISASYTSGGMTISAISNATDAVAGSSTSDKEYKELSVAFAF
jgi:outer membrane protein OmpU